MATQEHLKEACVGVSQANRTYLAYGERAAKDGFNQVAKLFRAVAAAETIHAHVHLRAMDGVKGTAGNLEEEAAGEKYGFEEMYPPMEVTEEEEGNRRAAIYLQNAMEVKKVHHALFNDASAPRSLATNAQARQTPGSGSSTPPASGVRARLLRENLAYCLSSDAPQPALFGRVEQLGVRRG